MRGFHSRTNAGPIAVLCAVMSAGVAAAESRLADDRTVPGPAVREPDRARERRPRQPAPLRERGRPAPLLEPDRVDSSGLDHTPVAPGENRIFGQQLGPGRSARAMAIVHIAIADAVASIKGGFKRYTSIPNAPAGASVDTAIATAAHAHAGGDVPVAPARGSSSSTRADLVDAPGTLQQKAKGVARRRRWPPRAILALRQNDGSNHPSR